MDVMGNKKGWSRKQGVGDMEAIIGRLTDVLARVSESLEGTRREATEHASWIERLLERLCMAAEKTFG